MVWQWSTKCLLALWILFHSSFYDWCSAKFCKKIFYSHWSTHLRLWGMTILYLSFVHDSWENRKLREHFNLLSSSLKILTDDKPANPPDDGVYIHGLFLDGARWNRDTRELDEAFPKILSDTVPVVSVSWTKLEWNSNLMLKCAHLIITPQVWFQPIKVSDLKQRDTYNCPLYKTSERRGVLATTGHSSNFIIAIKLPTSKSVDHWILRGTALLCQLSS